MTWRLEMTIQLYNLVGGEYKDYQCFQHRKVNHLVGIVRESLINGFTRNRGKVRERTHITVRLRRALISRGRVPVNLMLSKSLEAHTIKAKNITTFDQ